MNTPLFNADTMGSKEGLKIVISPGTNDGAFIDLVYKGESFIHWRYAGSEPASPTVKEAAKAIASYYNIKEPIATLKEPLAGYLETNKHIKAEAEQTHIEKNKKGAGK